MTNQTPFDFEAALRDVEKLVSLQYDELAAKHLREIDEQIESGGWRTLTIDSKHKLEQLRTQLIEQLTLRWDDFTEQLDEQLSSEIIELERFDPDVTRALLNRLGRMAVDDKFSLEYKGYERLYQQRESQWQQTQAIKIVGQEVDAVWTLGNEALRSGAPHKDVEEHFLRAWDNLQTNLAKYPDAAELKFLLANVGERLATFRLAKTNPFDLTTQDPQEISLAVARIETYQIENVLVLDENQQLHWMNTESVRIRLRQRLQRFVSEEFRKLRDNFARSRPFDKLQPIRLRLQNLSRFILTEQSDIDEREVTDFLNALDLAIEVAPLIRLIEEHLEAKRITQAVELYRDELLPQEATYMKQLPFFVELRALLARSLQYELEQHSQAIAELHAKGDFEHAQQRANEVLNDYAKLV